MNTCDTLINEDYIKPNALVYAITNRNGPFSFGVPRAQWFNPVQQDEAWLQLRASLFLNRTQTDYYSLLALSILNAHPDILSIFDDLNFTFDINNVELLESSIKDGGFTSVGSKNGCFKNYNGRLPIPELIKIRYRGASKLIVKTDVGREYIYDYTQSQRGDDTVLLVDWDNAVPLDGPLLYQGKTWNDTSNIDITYIPHGINYKEWIHYIEQKMDIIHVLNKSDLTTAYRVSDCYTEKLAVLIVSLALLNTSL